MPQILPPSANIFTRWSLIGGGIFVVLFVSALTFYARTDRNRVGLPVTQPVAFQHTLHAGELGLDCRYCHSSVERTAFATVPPTETCMTCHSQVRVNTPQLAEVTNSWKTKTPIAWTRVHDLADYVYFNHSAHVNSGVGCASCHGRVDQMDTVFKAKPMSMGWCLECHRDPAKELRPQNEVFNMAYQKPVDQHELGAELVKTYDIDVPRLSQCSTCHR